MKAKAAAAAVAEALHLGTDREAAQGIRDHSDCRKQGEEERD